MGFVRLGLVVLLGMAGVASAEKNHPRDYTYAILQGDFEAARAAMDERLKRGEQLALPMGREKSGGVDNWLLIVTPDRVAVTEGMGKLRSDAPITEVKVEGPGTAKAPPAAPNRTPGYFVRLKLAKKTYNLYFWPPSGERCEPAERFLSFNHYLQCGPDGALMQAFVAGYLAEVLSSRGAKSK
jgi:hypothetical protein